MGQPTFAYSKGDRLFEGLKTVYGSMSLTFDLNSLQNDRQQGGRITPRSVGDRYEVASQGSEHGTDGSYGLIGSVGGSDDLPARSASNKNVAALAKLREKQQRVVQALRTNTAGPQPQPIGIGRQVSFSEAQQQPALNRQFTESSVDGAGSVVFDACAGISAVASPVTANTELMKLLSEVKESQDTLFQALKEQRLCRSWAELQGSIQDGERRQSAIQGSVESQSTRLDILSTKVASQHQEHIDELTRMRGSLATEADCSSLRAEIEGLRAQQVALDKQNKAFAQIWVKEKQKLEAEVARLTDRNSELVQRLQAAMPSSQNGIDESLVRRLSTLKTMSSPLRIAALVSGIVAILGLAGSIGYGVARSTSTRISPRKTRAALIFGPGLRIRPELVPQLTAFAVSDAPLRWCSSQQRSHRRGCDQKTFLTQR